MDVFKSSIRAARLTAAASQHGISLARTQIAYMARMRYAEWQQALAMLVVAQDTLTAEAKNTQVTQQLFDVGKVPRFDFLRAQAAQASAQQQVTNALADVTVARAQLAQALGVPIETIPSTPAVETLPTPPHANTRNRISYASGLAGRTTEHRRGAGDGRFS